MSQTAFRSVSQVARAALLTAAVALCASAGTAWAQAKKTTAAAGTDNSACLACHQPIKAFHDAGKHKGLACASCHSGTDDQVGPGRDELVAVLSVLGQVAETRKP
jgi:cytochrome c551/c552